MVTESLTLEEKAVLDRYQSWSSLTRSEERETASRYETGDTEYGSCLSFCTGGACSANCRSAFPKED